jgi:hypothetical protein
MRNLNITFSGPMLGSRRSLSTGYLFGSHTHPSRDCVTTTSVAVRHLCGPCVSPSMVKVVSDGGMRLICSLCKRLYNYNGYSSGKMARVLEPLRI